MALLSMIPSPRRWAALLSFSLAPALAIAEAAATTTKAAAADYYVRNLPGLPADGPDVKMHAGHIEVTPESHGNLFFWHFENQHIADKQRTVIWINGGPGCSSEDGSMMEIGPYRLKDQDHLVYNNGSWNEFANLLFVDNPVGTGYSSVDTNEYIHELKEMADQFVQFLEKWFALFPQYDRDDIYIAGESYAGQHIPYIARAILDRNKKKSQAPWNLKGLLIGNGWISPAEQYPAYLTFALQKGIIEKDSDNHKKLQANLRSCEKMIASDPGHVDYGECEQILSDMLKLTKKGSGEDACVNMYDVRLKDTYPSCGMNWPPDLVHLTPYLRKPEVTSALHVDTIKKSVGWTECNGAVGGAFHARNSKPSIELLPALLKEVPIMLFSGAEDLICNHVGTENLISKMEWNGGKGFEVTPGNWAPRRDWTFEGANAGFWQEARNLTYVLVYNSSHMVPFDLPRRSRDMLDRFMGVDISSVGGDPADSRIDGEKGPKTSVGDAKNSTSTADEEHQQQLDEAKWAAYYKSGEVVLVIVIIGAVAWGYWIWRERRKGPSYSVLADHDLNNRPNSHRPKPKSQPGDLESAAFDESELDDLHVTTPGTSASARFPMNRDGSEKFVTKYAE